MSVAHDVQPLSVRDNHQTWRSIAASAGSAPNQLIERSRGQYQRRNGSKHNHDCRGAKRTVTFMTSRPLCE